MKITLLTDNPESWIVPYAKQLKGELDNIHVVNHIYDLNDFSGCGDVLFILGCEKIIKKESLKLHQRNIVIHPSLLPLGRGWSPLAWQILSGTNTIPFSLFEATEKVDSGDIYLVDYLTLEGHELNEEIKAKQGELTVKMVLQYLEQHATLKGVHQKGEPSYYQRRTKADSELDIDMPLKEQFNLLRVVDNKKYPAFFVIDGIKYILQIDKESN
jgi:methionyl-tRNA formyltransferase